MCLGDDGKIYSDQDFAHILSKATELARSSDVSRRPEGGLSLEDMKAIASEAGIDPTLIERAARLLAGTPQASRFDWVLGGPPRRRLQAAFSSLLTKEQTAHLLSVIRGFAEQQGVGEANSSGLVWRTHAGDIFVSAHNDGTGSRVLVTSDHRVGVAVTGVLGAAGGVVAAVLIASLLPFGELPDVFDMTLLGTSVLGGLALARSFWKSKTRKVRQTVDTLMETLNKALDPMSGREGASSDEEQS